MTPGPIIDIRGLGRRFGIEPPVDALVDVNLQVHSGEWVSIAGPSGSGKSTLLNILGLLDVPTSGTYRLAGSDVRALNDGQRAGLRSREIGFVFQAFHLIAYRTVIENVMLGDVYRKGPRRDRSDRGRAALERVGLGHRETFLPTRLSGGERQRAAIARGIMGSPSVFLCDEPTGNLDSTTTASVLDLFAELNRGGLTIVMITHEADVAARADRQVRIVDGRLTEAA